MPIKCEDYQQACVITVDGEFTADVSAAVRQAASQRIDEQHVIDFVFDLAKTPFVDSEGLETLLWLKRRSEERFGRTKLARVEDAVRHILEITRLEHRFECHADLPSALKTMR